jgi:ribosomal protein S12 methylthiotransferase
MLKNSPVQKSSFEGALWGTVPGEIREQDQDGKGLYDQISRPSTLSKDRMSAQPYAWYPLSVCTELHEAMNQHVRIGMISLGCSKNLVDSESILGELQKRGYSITEDIHDAHVAVINTCAFIKDATQESIDAILEAIELKGLRKIEALIVAGCLPQRYWKERLAQELKEVDAFVGVGHYHLIGDIIDKVLRGERAHAVGLHAGQQSEALRTRYRLTPHHYAYIKISEGCNNDCAYCVIPQLRGPYRSRRMKSIIGEVQRLSDERSLSEINLVGQDTTSYGTDLYGKPRLADLLRRIAQLNTVKWIRLLYTHPAHFHREVIEVIQEEPALCKYIDLPLQHINNHILKLMGRKVTRGQIERLLGQLRDRIPHVTLRTTCIVGFPGETEKHFAELIRFIKDVQFERLGAFPYSREEGTRAFDLPKQVPEKIKRERLDHLMKVQRGLSSKRNRRLIDTECEVLIDSPCEQEQDLYLARTEGDAPEVDQLVYVRGQGFKSGEFIRVRITDAYEYDLVAEPV